MKTTKVLNYLSYAIAVLSVLSILIWIQGGFEVARVFHRSLTDWQFVWVPGFFDTTLLVVAFVLAVKKYRIVFLLCLFYVLKSLAMNIQVLFGNGILVPDFLTLAGEVIYFLFLPISLLGVLLWVMEFYKGRRKKS